MAAKHSDAQTFEQDVLKSTRPVLVDFFAPWCGPCKMAAPILDKLADEFAGQVDVVKVDVDANPDLARQYQIMSIPAVVMFKNGQPVDQKVGFGGEQGYRSMIEASMK